MSHKRKIRSLQHAQFLIRFLGIMNPVVYFFNAALTLGTSSSISRMLGNGPKGVMANGLICPWLFV